MTKIDDNEKNTILFVDDEKICHHMMDLIIPNVTKYKIINALSGTEAIELAKRHANKLCLVLSDVLMPDINGYDLYEMFRQDEKLKHIPFIFQSGMSANETAFKKHLKNENVAFICKPYKQTYLIEVIDRTLKAAAEK